MYCYLSDESWDHRYAVETDDYTEAAEKFMEHLWKDRRGSEWMLDELCIIRVTTGQNEPIVAFEMEIHMKPVFKANLIPKADVF